MFACIMNIVSHIEELLFRYECVIIPGFGAFLMHHQSAFVDSETHTFVPPSKSLSFNRQLQTNDGLLASHLAVMYGLTYREALEEIREQVDIWINQLENNTPLGFNGLGILQNNEENKWQFTPDTQNIFQAVSFGLTSVENQPILREIDATQKIITLPIEPKNSTSLSKYVRYVGVAAIGLLLGVGGLAWYQKDTQQYNLVQQQIAEKELEKQIHTASFTIVNPLPAITLTLPKEKNPYHIVAGAFREFENADKRVEELRQAGYNARILRKNSYGLHEVVYSSYSSKRDAINQMNKIVRTHNENAWLLVDED